MAKDLTDALAGKIATVVRELTEYGDCPSTAEGLCDIVVALKDVAAGIRDFRDVEEMVLVLQPPPLAGN